MSKIAGVHSAVGRVKGGVEVQHNKYTAEMETVRIPEPSLVVLPMQQHIGAPCTAKVKPGDHVFVGQTVGDSEKPVSAPIHSSVSGKVRSVAEVKLANGLTSQAVTIESDGALELWEGIEPPKVENRQQLISAVRRSGLVGLGGAGFPSHVKINIPEGKHVDTLIVNAAECEPYITVDYRECIENTQNILSGIHILKDLLEIEKVIIAVEDNKPLALRALKAAAPGDFKRGTGIRLMTLKSRYPQGAEKMMVLSATGRAVPVGKLPADAGCIVMNVASVAFIARYLATGKPLVSRTVTVDGTAIKNPMNVRVPVGTSIQDIIDFCGGYEFEPMKIIAGGPMMGKAIYDTQAPMLKSNNAILAFAEDPAMKKRRSCIRCGRCVSVCPMKLLPSLTARYAATGNIDMLKRTDVTACMECGCCAYACPSALPLVQYMALGKQLIREEGKKPC